MKRTKLKNALSWTWEFTKIVITALSVLYALNWLYSVVAISVAIYETNQFSFLDTLITETNETFRVIVGVNVVKCCIENVFKYNDFGGKGNTYNKNPTSEDNPMEVISEECEIEEECNQNDEQVKTE